MHQQQFRTPRGASVMMWVREDTSDHNTCYSALNEDEYGLAELFLEGRALDVGAHIGSVTVALLADNPQLHVTALEAVPPNVELIQRNLAENGLTDRCTVVSGAACKPKQKTAVIHYGFHGSESAEHHAFIGNALLVKQQPGTGERVGCHSLSEFTPLDFMKIDCEGCEWDFLWSDAMPQVARIHGEWHPVGVPISATKDGRTEYMVQTYRQTDMRKLLESQGFSVTFSGPEAGPGGFVAVPR